MHSRKSLQSILPKILIVALFLFIVLYAHSRTAFLSQGVSLSVQNLEDGQTLSSSILEIEGTAKRAVRLTFNNREVLIDEKGNFLDTVILSPGLNVLVIEAEDKFGNDKNLSYSLWQNQDTLAKTDTLIAEYKGQKTVEISPPEKTEESVNETELENGLENQIEDGLVEEKIIS